MADALADVIDKAGTEKSALFLVKLALMNANTVGDSCCFKAMSQLRCLMSRSLDGRSIYPRLMPTYCEEMKMKIQTWRVTRAAASLLAILGLAACVTPQIKQSSAPAQQPSSSSARVANSSAGNPAVQPQQRTGGSPAPVQPQPSAATTPLMASKKFLTLLEQQLICPSRGDLAINQVRAALAGERVFGAKKQDYAGDTESYPVLGDVSVFGLKVVRLELTGNNNDEGGSIFVEVKAKPAEVIAAYKLNKVTLKKSRRNTPGLWLDRQAGNVTGFSENQGKLLMGCYVPID